MTALFKDSFYELYADPGRVLRLVRTAQPFESLEEVPRTHEELNRVVLARQPREQALLIDLRAGRGRNDPEFERAGVAARKLLMSLFARVAIVVRTAAGLLQVQRMMRDEQSGARAFLDENEALAWLKER